MTHSRISWLYGWVIVFKFVAKNGRIDYVATNMETPTRNKIETIIRKRWEIEVYHRELKQSCGIERCQARTSRAQRNHIFMAISAWFDKYKRKLEHGISFYQQDWNVIKDSISLNIKFILHNT